MSKIENKNSIPVVQKILEGAELKAYLEVIDPVTGKTRGQDYFEKYKIIPLKLTVLESSDEEKIRKNESVFPMSKPVVPNTRALNSNQINYNGKIE